MMFSSPSVHKWSQRLGALLLVLAMMVGSNMPLGMNSYMAFADTGGTSTQIVSSSSRISECAKMVSTLAKEIQSFLRRVRSRETLLNQTETKILNGKLAIMEWRYGYILRNCPRSESALRMFEAYFDAVKTYIDKAESELDKVDVTGLSDEAKEYFEGFRQDLELLGEGIDESEATLDDAVDDLTTDRNTVSTLNYELNLDIRDYFDERDATSKKCQKYLRDYFEQKYRKRINALRLAAGNARHALLSSNDASVRRAMQEQYANNIAELKKLYAELAHHVRTTDPCPPDNKAVFDDSGAAVVDVNVFSQNGYSQARRDLRAFLSELDLECLREISLWRLQNLEREINKLIEKLNKMKESSVERIKLEEQIDTKWKEYLEQVESDKREIQQLLDNGDCPRSPDGIGVGSAVQVNDDIHGDIVVPRTETTDEGNTRPPIETVARPDPVTSVPRDESSIGQVSDEDTDKQPCYECNEDYLAELRERMKQMVSDMDTLVLQIDVLKVGGSDYSSELQRLTDLIYAHHAAVTEYENELIDCEKRAKAASKKMCPPDLSLIPYFDLPYELFVDIFEAEDVEDQEGQTDGVHSAADSDKKPCYTCNEDFLDYMRGFIQTAVEDVNALVEEIVALKQAGKPYGSQLQTLKDRMKDYDNYQSEYMEELYECSEKAKALEQMICPRYLSGMPSAQPLPVDLFLEIFDDDEDDRYDGEVDVVTNPPTKTPVLTDPDENQSTSSGESIDGTDIDNVDADSRDTRHDITNAATIVRIRELEIEFNILLETLPEGSICYKYLNGELPEYTRDDEIGAFEYLEKKKRKAQEKTKETLESYEGSLIFLINRMKKLLANLDECPPVSDGNYQDFFMLMLMLISNNAGFSDPGQDQFDSFPTPRSNDLEGGCIGDAGSYCEPTDADSVIESENDSFTNDARSLDFSSDFPDLRTDIDSAESEFSSLYSQSTLDCRIQVKNSIDAKNMAADVLTTVEKTGPREKVEEALNEYLRLTRFVNDRIKRLGKDCGNKSNAGGLPFIVLLLNQIENAGAGVSPPFLPSLDDYLSEDSSEDFSLDFVSNASFQSAFKNFTCQSDVDANVDFLRSQEDPEKPETEFTPQMEIFFEKLREQLPDCQAECMEAQGEVTPALSEAEKEECCKKSREKYGWHK